VGGELDSIGKDGGECNWFRNPNQCCREVLVFCSSVGMGGGHSPSSNNCTNGKSSGFRGLVLGLVSPNILQPDLVLTSTPTHKHKWQGEEGQLLCVRV
jgi:hypothetical protein